jgi:hypothetical protein
MASGLAQQGIEAFPLPRVRASDLLQESERLAGGLEIPPRAAGSERVIFEARGREALAFKPAQRDEHGRLRHGPACALLERQNQGHTVAFAPVPQHRQKHVQFEVLEGLLRHGGPHRI